MDETAEQWRAVNGYEGLYEVSSHGRVRSLDRLTPMLCHGVVVMRRTKGQIRKVSPKVRRGQISHMEVNLFRQPEGYDYCAVHALVLEAFVGGRPTAAHQGAHWDRDPSNNVLGNLRWATPAENSMDKLRHGTMYQGERQHLSVLTEDAVRVIRASDKSGPELAKVYGVTRSAINDCRARRTWKHI